MPLTKVLLEPVRSAEPPTRSGLDGANWSSAAPEAARVASAGGASSTLAMWASSLAKAWAGSSPFMARSNSSFSAELNSRAAQRLRTVVPRPPTLRQAATSVSGRTKGSCAQSSFSRVAAISTLPSALPWVS